MYNILVIDLLISAAPNYEHIKSVNKYYIGN